MRGRVRSRNEWKWNIGLRHVRLRGRGSVRGEQATSTLYQTLRSSGIWDGNALGWNYDAWPDGFQLLRYNRGCYGRYREAETSVLGRSQAARRRVLVPGSQVRILPPQPESRPATLVCNSLKES